MDPEELKRAMRKAAGLKAGGGRETPAAQEKEEARRDGELRVQNEKGSGCYGGFFSSFFFWGGGGGEGRGGSGLRLLVLREGLAFANPGRRDCRG